MKKILLIFATLFAMTFAAKADGAVATPASFPGGEEAMTQWLASNIHYPEIARQNLVEGTVTVSFVVEADGSVKNAKIDHPLDPDLEEEALRMVNSFPKWMPAKDASGNPTEQTVTIPVCFRL